MTALQGVPTYGNGAGVYDVTDDKLAMAGLLFQTAPGVVLPGVIYAGVDTLVTGTAGMAYSVASYRCATSRGASGGVILGGNDGALSVSTTAAPGSNSRIDLIVHWQREFQVDGVDSEPVIFVVQGTAGAVPVAPSLASYPGAIELARATVTAGATATNGGGVTILQTFPMTCAAGGIPRFRSTTERDARFPSPWEGAQINVAGSPMIRGTSAWGPLASARRQRDTTNSTITPLTQVGTAKVTGTNAANVTKAITFPTPFKSGTVPAVAATGIGFRSTGAFNDAGLSVGGASLAAGAPSDSGFTAQLSALSGSLGSSFDYYFSWIAIGEAP